MNILTVRICNERNLVTDLSLLGWKYNKAARIKAWITPAADINRIRDVEIVSNENNICTWLALLVFENKKLQKFCYKTALLPLKSTRQKSPHVMKAFANKHLIFT